MLEYIFICNLLIVNNFKLLVTILCDKLQVKNVNIYSCKTPLRLFSHENVDTDIIDIIHPTLLLMLSILICYTR